jgi:hypothetical protein
MGAVAQPVLKQFAELRFDDFDRHPVWIGCHTADYGELWYDATDEETFRPRVGTIPADRSEGTLLVRATAILSDGTRLPGFLTPGLEPELGIIQPHVFVGSAIYGFWGGIAGVAEATRDKLYADTNKTPDQIFPVRVTADQALCGGVAEAIVTGWSRACRS